MIYGVVGLPGSGKTLFLTLMGYVAYRKNYKVMSNYKLGFDHQPISFDELARFKIENVVLLWDEIHMLFDSRRSMSLVNMAISYLVLQSRKRNINLVYSTQTLNQIDRRLRLISNYYVICEKDKVKKRFIYRFLPQAGKVFTYILPYYKAYRLYPLFDTSEYYDIIESLKLSKRLAEAMKNELSAA